MNYPLKKRNYFLGGREERSNDSTNEAYASPKSSPAPWESEPPALIPLESLDSSYMSLDVSSDECMSTENSSSCHHSRPTPVDRQSSNSLPRSSRKDSTCRSSRSCRDSKQSRRHRECPNSSAFYDDSNEASSDYEDRYEASSDCLGFPIDDIVEDLVDFFKGVIHTGEERNQIAHREPEPRYRIQKCSFCLNHGIEVLKKGHKWDCAFAKCECERCVITKRRQMTMRAQQKLSRELQQK